MLSLLAVSFNWLLMTSVARVRNETAYKCFVVHGVKLISSVAQSFASCNCSLQRPRSRHGTGSSTFHQWRDPTRRSLTCWPDDLPNPTRVAHGFILCDPIQLNPSADWPNPTRPDPIQLLSVNLLSAELLTKFLGLFYSGPKPTQPTKNWKISTQPDPTQPMGQPNPWTTLNLTRSLYFQVIRYLVSSSSRPNLCTAAQCLQNICDIQV